MSLTLEVLATNPFVFFIVFASNDKSYNEHFDMAQLVTGRGRSCGNIYIY